MELKVDMDVDIAGRNKIPVISGTTIAFVIGSGSITVGVEEEKASEILARTFPGFFIPMQRYCKKMEGEDTRWKEIPEKSP